MLLNLFYFVDGLDFTCQINNSDQYKFDNNDLIHDENTTKAWIFGAVSTCLIGASLPSAWAESTVTSTASADLVLPSNPDIPPTSVAYPVELRQLNQSNEKNLLDYIPAWVDAMPTMLPKESDQVMVPSVNETENKTWVDRKQNKFAIGLIILQLKLMTGLVISTPINPPMPHYV